MGVTRRCDDGIACAKMVKMAAFVTGGGGYVGRLLCQELVQHGYSVTAYDLAFPESANDRSEIISVRVSYQ